MNQVQLVVILAKFLCVSCFIIVLCLGELRLKAPIGAEEQTQWSLIISAFDGAGATTQTAVHLILVNVTEGRPVFEQREYATCITSNSLDGTTILEVRFAVWLVLCNLIFCLIRFFLFFFPIDIMPVVKVVSTLLCLSF